MTTDVATTITRPYCAITVYLRVYGPWPTDENGDQIDGERPVIREDTETIESNGDEFEAPVEEALSWLRKEGFNTKGAEWGEQAWLTATYDHPYESIVEERHAFLAGFSESACRYIWAELA